MSAASPSPEAQSLPSYRWIIAFLALLTFLVSMISRFAWPPLIPVVVPVLNFSMTEAGAYMMAFYIGYVITQLPSGMLADRFGVRVLLSLTLLVQAVATYLLGTIETFQGGFALRVISGLSGGCVYAACFRAIVKWFPPKERGLAFGILMSGPALGLALANGFVPSLETAFDWRWVFKAIGVFSLVCAGIVYALMRDNPPTPAAGPGSGPPPKPKPFIDGLRYCLSNRNILLLCVGGFCYIWAYVGFVSWGNAYLKEQVEGITLAQAGAIMFGMAMIGLLTTPFAGALAGKTGQGRLFLVVASVVLILGIILFGQSTSVPLLWFFALCVGVAAGVMTPVYSLVVSTYSPPEWAGSAGGITGCFWQMAGAAVPLVTGMSLDATGTFGTVWWIIAAAPMLGLVILLLLTKPKLD